jgi:hypothetical protein
LLTPENQQRLLPEGVIISFKLLFLLKASLAVFLKQIFESKKQQQISLRKGSKNN